MLSGEGGRETILEGWNRKKIWCFSYKWPHCGAIGSRHTRNVSCLFTHDLTIHHFYGSMKYENISRKKIPPTHNENIAILVEVTRLLKVKQQSSLRDAVLVKGVQLVAVLVSGFLVQVAEMLHGWHASFGALLGDVQFLYKLQSTWTFISVLVGTTVMTLTEKRWSIYSWLYWSM